jgi:hypothetical protein
MYLTINSTSDTILILTINEVSKMKFTYYTDPGHGWVKVPRRLLEKLKIAEKISYFSYSRGDSVYLEEDCDLSHLITALEAQGTKVDLVFKSTNRQSKIRSYNTYIA